MGVGTTGRLYVVAWQLFRSVYFRLRNTLFFFPKRGGTACFAGNTDLGLSSYRKKLYEGLPSWPWHTHY
jgi:hypothetical protein